MTEERKRPFSFLAGIVDALCGMACTAHAPLPRVLDQASPEQNWDDSETFDLPYNRQPHHGPVAHI